MIAPKAWGSGFIGGTMAIISAQPATECIAYEVRKLDTHGAFSKKSKMYTIVRDGMYIVRTGSKRSKRIYKAGDVIFDPNSVIDELCENTLEAMRSHGKR